MGPVFVIAFIVQAFQIPSPSMETTLLVGDYLLLCSDGLTRMVTDPEIASTLLTSTTAQEAADRLVETANENGGVDNISVIALQIVQKSDGVLERLKVWKRNSG